jgi:hypothetical protein
LFGAGVSPLPDAAAAPLVRIRAIPGCRAKGGRTRRKKMIGVTTGIRTSIEIAEKTTL